MPNLSPKPNTFKPGTTQLTARALNEIRDIGIRQIRGGDSVNVSDFGDRVLIQGMEGQSFFLPDIGNYITTFLVLSELDDYLMCTPFHQPGSDTSFLPKPYTYNPSELADNPIYGSNYPVVYVVKPFQLQKTAWQGLGMPDNGVSLLFNYPGIGYRTVVSGANLPMTQSIEPNYAPGDMIHAVQGVTGYGDRYGIPIIWMDLNIAARKWWNPGKLKGVLQSSLSYGGTATMTVDGWTGGDLTVHNWFLKFGDVPIASGSHVSAFFQDWQWWVDNSWCP